MLNGIDVTDTTRYFSRKELTQLEPEGRKMIANLQNREAFKQKSDKSKKRKRNRLFVTIESSGRKDKTSM